MFSGIMLFYLLGGYSLCVTPEQFEELKKRNVFEGINLTYRLQGGNYIIKLTTEDYDSFLNNKKVAGPMTSMQYNASISSGSCI